MLHLETDYPGINALRKSAGEIRVHVENYASIIPNYAERYRHGERVSTRFVEGTVNTVVGKRYGSWRSLSQGHHCRSAPNAPTYSGVRKKPTASSACGPANMPVT